MSYSSVVLADSPIRYYRLGEASGTVATDIGSQAQNGTLTGGVTPGGQSLFPGDSGASMLFDGTSGYVATANAASVGGFSALSIECWASFVRLDDYYRLVSSDDTSTSHVGFDLYIDAPSRSCNVIIGNGTTGVFGWQTPTLSVGPTYHIVFTYDGANIRTYLNGQPTGSPVAQSGTIGAPLGPITLARNGTATFGYLPGRLAHVAVYSAALTDAQVSLHYTAAMTVIALKPRYSARALGATIIPDRVSQPLAYVRRAFGATLIYETRTFIPRALGGIYLPDTVLWIPRALGSTTPDTVALAGTLAGVGTLAGTISLTTQLSDTLAGVGTLAGTLSFATALSDTLAGTGTLPATLSYATALASTCAGVGTLTGAPTLATALSAPLTGVGTLTASVPALSTALSMQLAGAGTIVETLSLATQLAATCTGVGQLAGAPVFRVALATTLPGVGTLSGSLAAGGNVALAGTAAGVGTLAGTAQLATALTGTLAGVGMLTGTLAARGALSSTQPGQGALVVALSLATALVGTCPGVGAPTGVFSLRVSLSCAFMGMGTLAGTFSVAGVTTQFLTATWVTRDGKATWITRDEQDSWKTRDNLDTWKTRG